MTTNIPKILPKCSQKASKTPLISSKILPRHPKMAPRRFKMPPRRLQDPLWHSRTHPRHAPDAPKTRQDYPRHFRTPQKRLQDLSKARFFMFEKPKILTCNGFFLSINPNKHLSMEVGTAECAERLIVFVSSPLASNRPRRDARSVNNTRGFPEPIRVLNLFL